MRKVVFFLALSLLIGLWITDRWRLTRTNAESKQLALEDGLRRQLAIVERDRVHLLTPFVRVSTQDREKLDLIVLFTVSDELKRLWKHEADINQGDCERVTVSGKRLLSALNHRGPDDFFDYVEEQAKRFFWKGEFETAAYFELTDEELASFREFLRRSSIDNVAEGEDLPTLLENSPKGEYRMF